MADGTMARRRFSLVELMIVVAIIAVLAAIAIPAVFSYQCRAKLAEGVVNADGLADSAYSTAIANDLPAYSATQHPRQQLTLDRSPVAWTYSTPAAEWANASWLPDGAVRCSYSLGVTYVATTGGTVQAIAFCDVDNDNRIWSYSCGVSEVDSTGCKPHKCQDDTQANTCSQGPNCQCY